MNEDFFATLLTFNNLFDVDIVSDKNERLNFESYKLRSVQVSNKIFIDGNQGWADFKSDGNCTGLGTFSDPYSIKDIVIDCKNSGRSIIIENSTEYFKIVNLLMTISLSTVIYISFLIPRNHITKKR